jgi:hypothetical protein
MSEAPPNHFMHRTRKKVGIFFGMAPVAPAMTLLGTGEKQQRRLTLIQSEKVHGRKDRLI